MTSISYGCSNIEYKFISKHDIATLVALMILFDYAWKIG